MSIGTLSRRLFGRLSAAAIAVATAATLGLVATPEASAQALGPGCQWDAAGSGLQRCAVWSEAMGRDITVQIRPGGRALYMLDGQRAPEAYNDWVPNIRPMDIPALNGYTLVLPVGGSSTFYQDFNTPRNAIGSVVGGSTLSGSVLGDKIMWETFLTRELPAYLQAHFGVAPQGNVITGFSMGGTAAYNLAGKHRDQFKAAASFSGYLDTQSPGIPSGISLGMLSVNGYSSASMWGSSMGATWTDNNPMANIGRYHGMALWASAATGQPMEGEPFDVQGNLLETTSHGNTLRFVGAARGAGIHVDGVFDRPGMHNWNTWRRDFQDSLGWFMAQK